MKNKQVFDILKTNFSRGEINVENFLPFRIETPEDNKVVELKHYSDSKVRDILKEPRHKVIWPRICLHEYLNDVELKQLNEIKAKRDIRKFIDKRIPKFCKEPARTLFTELMYNLIKFARQYNFNLKQTGALLSQFYLTHKIFLSSFNIAAEKLYLYFKEIMICHSVASPPDSIKIFSMEESESIMKFFCMIYLRNIPLIRTMCLPNYAFHLDTSLEVETLLPKKLTTTNEKIEKGKNRKKNK